MAGIFKGTSKNTFSPKTKNPDKLKTFDELDEEDVQFSDKLKSLTKGKGQGSASVIRLNERIKIETIFSIFQRYQHNVRNANYIGAANGNPFDLERKAIAYREQMKQEFAAIGLGEDVIDFSFVPVPPGCKKTEVPTNVKVSSNNKNNAYNDGDDEGNVKKKSKTSIFKSKKK